MKRRMGEEGDTTGRAKNSARQELGSSVAHSRRFGPRPGRYLSLRHDTRVDAFARVPPSQAKTNPTPRLKTGADTRLQQTTPSARRVLRPATYASRPFAERLALFPPSRYSREVTKKVLFICTGNFYRSRFAEALFNFHADQRKLPWQAYSRGLAIHWAEGFLSPFTEAALSQREIPLSYTGPGRIQLTEKDLESADLCIALDRAEHLDMMEQQFPHWTQRIQYWEVPDMPATQPEKALPAIESQILHLLDHLPNEP
jgi:low molecular weight protein-tyrosine phosphatase